MMMLWMDSKKGDQGLLGEQGKEKREDVVVVVVVVVTENPPPDCLREIFVQH